MSTNIIENNNLFCDLWFISSFIFLIINIVNMLCVTLIIAAMTLVERKYLALIQRRVGPKYVGYRGRLQYIADALKLFGKGIFIPAEINKFWFITVPSIVLGVCYSFWLNAVWGPSLMLFELEYNFFYISFFSLFFGVCVVLTGFVSQNKYAILASIRAIISVVNLELFLSLMLLTLILVGQSFSMLNVIVLQEFYWLLVLFSAALGFLIITFLVEVNRTPFDLSEAESEIIAGYTIEYGGFFFGLYYLGEYLHLFFFSIVYSCFFLGGWELPNFFLFFVLQHFFF
jgi:NADH-quinone oxidoreductase subunit H